MEHMCNWRIENENNGIHFQKQNGYCLELAWGKSILQGWANKDYKSDCCWIEKRWPSNGRSAYLIWEEKVHLDLFIMRFR